MKQILAVTLVWSAILGGLFSAGVASAEIQHGARHQERYGAGGGHHPHQAEHHGPGGGHREHHAEHHGHDKHKGHHRASGRTKDKESFARHWKKTLTPEQRTQIDQLRVSNAKTSAPLKASMVSIKIDLALLATAEKPDTAAIQQHVDQLLELKKKVMQQRYAHIAAVREVLTPEQRASYDMMILNQARKRKRGGRW